MPEDNYRDIFNKLSDYTNEFTLSDGDYSFSTKSEITNAEDILKQYYQKVRRKGLDYKNSKLDGTDYIIEFSGPITYVPDLSPEKANEGPLGNGLGLTTEDYDLYGALHALNEGIEKHDELNQNIWNDKELKPEVKEKLQLIADTFIEKLKEDDIPIDVKDIILVGSNVNYNYTKDSDLDLHIQADLSQFKGREKELAEKIYQCKKAMFNSKYDISLYGVPVEIYVEPYQDVDNNGIPDAVEEE
jgi:hypothetical protein